MVSGTKKNEKGFDVKNRVIREEGCRATLISRPMLLLIEIDNRSSSILSKRKKKRRQHGRNEKLAKQVGKEQGKKRVSVKKKVEQKGNKNVLDEELNVSKCSVPSSQY